MAAENEWPQMRSAVPYSNISKRNTLQTCLPRPPSTGDNDRLWVIYVHGGAWFFPGQSAADFNKAQELLLKSSVLEHIAGFASIDYRLSPAPDHKKYPSKPDDPARNARHPDHIHDVLSAIEYLQHTHQFGNRYILVGHSCGAALVLQVAMKRYWGSQDAFSADLEKKIDLPAAILGVEGIYDLPALVKYHAKDPFYRTFIERAFGASEDVWRTVSPTSSDLNETWKDGKLVMIAHSHNDELVEFEQAELMMKSLQAQRFSGSGERQAKLVELTCKHEEVWELGTDMARTIEVTITTLKGCK